MSPEAKMFSPTWYDEYYTRADASPTHSQFCQQVYGRDLCQHGMMDMQELNFLISMLQLGGDYLEIGCGNGHISEYIHRYTSGSLLGLDSSRVAIQQAKNRCKEKTGLKFVQLDVQSSPLPSGPYDGILLIDSIYFLGEPQEILPQLLALLKPRGRILVSFFQTREKGDPKTILQADHTLLARALDQHACRWVSYDFTSNVRSHWLKNYAAAEALQAAFAAEGNQFLYEARRAENEPFKQHVEANTITRFLYVIEARN